VSGCCQPRAYERIFGAKQARLDANRYRKRGLGGTARDLVELAGDVSGATVLEVGGGVGAIEVELLSAGAERATNVEISGEYEEEAAKLLAERGLADRVDRRVVDFVLEPVEPHDVVVMHRVVCCYPDVDGLVGAAAARTRRRMVLTYPRGRPWNRLGVGVINLFLRVSRSDFRVFVHPVARMASAAERKGLALERREGRGLIWENAAFARLPMPGDGNGRGMEPRHQERAADELTAERVEEAIEGSPEPRGGDDIRPKDDDTRHDASADEESQI
jgi:magnesium-protoporphyrin O-methyltransferase